jgi:hypothetical protein
VLVSTATGVLRRHVRPVGATDLAAVIAAAAVTTALVLSMTASSATLERYVAVVAFGGVAAWMFLSERYAVTLSVFLLYLGLVDGFLKLRTGSSLATLGRDVLLYAIAGGGLVRLILRGAPVRLPRLTAIVAIWVMAVVVQIFNPAVPSITHAVVSVRQHIEFVPLFFLGYAVVRTERRLLGMLALLLVAASANGLVSRLCERGFGDRVSDRSDLRGRGRSVVRASAGARI